MSARRLKRIRPKFIKKPTRQGIRRGKPARPGPPAGFVSGSRYQSIFSSRVPSPPVRFHSHVWDTIAKRLPAPYSIPDPVFQSFLAKKPR